jgi:hypothetical protein
MPAGSAYTMDIHGDLILDVGGNVGIGATSPSAKLTVEGTFSVRTSSNQSFNDSNNANNLTMTDSKVHFNIDGADKDFQVSSDTVTHALFVQGSDGNVGIGTGSPLTALHIENLGTGSANFNKGIIIKTGDNSYTSGHGPMLEFRNEDVYMAGIRGIRGAGWEGGLQFFTHNGSNGNVYGTTFLERMRIDSSGNVGIGTTNPGKKLDVNGEARITTGLTITPATSSVYATDSTLSSYATGNGVYLNGHADGWLRLNGSGANRASIDVWGENYAAPFADAITFRTGGTAERMMIASNGNVGIGTTGPNESLHIYRSSGDASFRLQSASQQLRIDQNSIRTTTNSSIGIFTNGNTNQMYLNQSTGNVGIGTSSPNQKLDVSGVTRSHKMEIQSSSSDATFLNIINQAGGVDSRIDLKTSANNGGDPFIFFDAGGSNMVVGNHWSGTTNNQLRMGTGGSVSSSSFKGISIDGLGKIISGPAIHINEGRGGSNTFNITNSSEAYNLMMPSFYGAGSINETYRHAYTINTPFHTTLWQGGGGNTVFTTWSKIGAEHYRDIYVETYTLYYSDLRIKVVTDGNAGISVWYAGATYQNNVYSARWRVYPLQACTLTMNPSSSYSSFYHVHTASGGREESGTATAATGSGPSTW